MNIILPVAGLGQRFINENYSLPKPLIKVLGKPIIWWCLNSLKPNNNDIIYIVYKKEFDNLGFTNTIKYFFPNYNIVFISIDNDTRGAAETVLYAINKIPNEDLDKLTIVVDADNFYSDNILDSFRDINDTCIFYTKDYQNNPIYSYIKINSSYIIDIKEKNKISDDACVGVYGFKDANLLKKTIIETILDNKKEKNEYYISLLYNYLLRYNHKIIPILTNNVTCLGTPNQVKVFASNLNISYMPKQIFCFDLDNTLVTTPEIFGDYSTVKPIYQNINFVNFLYDNNHKIIIYTARRMKTHDGDVKKVIQDIGEVTMKTLKNFGIKYHEIIFGKPYANFYIDDLAVNAYDNLEKEIGIYNIHPDTRSFNKIEIYNTYITKYSKNIDGEKYFYMNMPECIADQFPKLLDSGDNFITIEKINGMPISSVYANQLLTKNILHQIFDSLQVLHSIKPDNNNINIYDNYTNKLIDRINNYNFNTFSNFNNTLQNILNELKIYENNNLGKIGLIHGDPVFSNILLDINDNIKFIDMRGKLGINLSIYGDIFYDYSKVYQSIIGYDFILMNKIYNIEYINYFKNIFIEYITQKYDSVTMNNIKNITKSLIISLIPLHPIDKASQYYKLLESI